MLHSTLEAFIAKYKIGTELQDVGAFLQDVNESFLQYEQRLTDATYKCELVKTHLDASQRMAKMGSFEVDVSDIQNPRRIYWSNELYRILEVEPESDTSEVLELRFTHPDDRRTLVEKIQQAVNGNLKSIALEQRCLGAKGTEKPVFMRNELTYDEQGKPLRLIGTVQDISERKNTMLKLEKAHEELRSLFHNMEEVFFSVEVPTGKVKQISSSCEKVYGYTPREFIKDPELWYKCILDEDKHIVDSNRPELAKGHAFTQTYRLRRKDGEVRWLESRIIPTMGADGSIVKMDGITSDVTKRKEAEIALKNSEEKFRFLIEHGSDVITINSSDSVITFISDSVYNVTGFTREESIGKSSFHFIHPDDMAIIEQHRVSVRGNSAKPERVKYRRLKKDGSYFWCEGTAINLLDEPAVGGIVVNFRDITEQMAFEEALLSSNKELKKSNEELDKLVYSISHDLRAPLTSMLGIINIAELEVSDPLAIEYLDMIKSSINKLDNFIRDILDYSKNMRLGVRGDNVDFDKLLDNLRGNLKFMTGNVDIRINVEKDALFYTDALRVSMILNNLISNSIKYYNTEITNPYVDVVIKHVGNDIQMQICDNGIGIDEDKQTKVFDMFYRVSDRSIGSGLGLYIVKETVEKLNGSIALQSTPGEGSIFTVMIPDLKP